MIYAVYKRYGYIAQIHDLGRFKYAIEVSSTCGTNCNDRFPEDFKRLNECHNALKNAGYTLVWAP